MATASLEAMQVNFLTTTPVTPYGAAAVDQHPCRCRSYRSAQVFHRNESDTDYSFVTNQSLPPRGSHDPQDCNRQREEATP